jgi:hypothetical protein
MSEVACVYFVPLLLSNDASYFLYNNSSVSLSLSPYAKQLCFIILFSICVLKLPYSAPVLCLSNLLFLFSQTPINVFPFSFTRFSSPLAYRG